ncbi:MAG: GNAT family N-acetyltransferase [Actinobacteria bacterium]|nr:GNAT family N-acetyltransferase [Actinomycetota bacterium]
MKQRLAYPDLGATVELGEVRDDLLAELPALYGSLFSTSDWFDLFFDRPPTGCCILEDPRHVLVFGRDGRGTVEIYNRTFEITPRDAERACRALFRVLPFVHRIRLHVLFAPGELRLPTRVLGTRDHLMLDLPGTAEEWEASLGRSTRRNLKLYENRLRRAYPDARTEVIDPRDRAEELLDLIVAWKVARFSAKGLTTYWETRPDEYTLVFELLKRGNGEAVVTTVDGRVAAIVLLFWIGQSVCAQEWAHDPAFDSLHLGFVCLRAAIRHAISRGAVSMDLLWGNEQYKERFGARHVPSSGISVFPTRRARLHTLREERQVAWRRLRREGSRRYWQARHQAGRVVRGATARVRAARTPNDTEEG